MDKIPLLVVCGPTASGKTKLSIDLAARLNGEIIGADSMQIYRGMDIGTAKPTPSEMREIPHHLVDFLDPWDNFSVADYVTLAKKAACNIASRKKLPVVAGGTGLYISSLIDNISFEDTGSDENLRRDLKNLAAEKGAGFLHKLLKERDPALAEKLHPNNLGRVIRALEVYELTGKTMSELQEKSRENPPEYDLCMIGINFRDREKLYARINLRVDEMLEQGLLEEAESLLKAGYMRTAAQAIGYKELQKYLAGKETLDCAAENIKRETRRYAKRQMTWLRRDSRINWLFHDDYNDYTGLLEAALKIIGMEIKWAD